jgi:transportin-1
MFSQYAAGIFARCINIIHRNLQEGAMATENPSMEAPDKDFLITSLDLLSAIIQALEPQDSAQLVAGTSNFFQLVAICMNDSNNDVRQSAYALLGDCAIYVFAQLQPCLPTILEILINQIDVTQAHADVSETGYSVINNACWSVGEIAMRQKDGMLPYAERLLQKIGTILFDAQVPESLNENAAIALGRLGLGCSQYLSVHLAQIAPGFLGAIKKVMWNDEKCHALTGFMEIIKANPGAMEQSLLEFFSEMAMADRNFMTGSAGQSCRKAFAEVSGHAYRHATHHYAVHHANMTVQIIQQYKTMIPDFDGFLGSLPEGQRVLFRELYGV